MSFAKQTKVFVAELGKYADRKNSALFKTDELTDIAVQMNLGVTDMFTFLDMLNDQSYLLKKGNRLWQLTTHRTSTAASSQMSYR